MTSDLTPQPRPATPGRGSRLSTSAGDAALTAVVSTLTLLPLLQDDSVSEAVWWLSAGLLLPLLVVRTAPLWSGAVMVGFAVAQVVIDVHVPADLAVMIALFTIASRCPRPKALVALGVLEVLGIVASFRIGPSHDGQLASLVFTTGLIAAGFFAGVSVQERRLYLASVEDRADRLEREQAQLEKLAVTGERTRIAREMHDIVAHSLSVMITLAEAARAASSGNPRQADQAMAQVASTGRDAMAEMRKLLGVLREDGMPTPLLPQPGLGQLDDLVEEARLTGLQARLTTTGTPAAMPGALQTTVYRIVQEALTNVRKHARQPNGVTISLVWDAAQLCVTVQDDGRTDGADPAPAKGHGLVGMTERVAVFGGDLVAGPVAGGWLVDARLPLGAAR